MNLLQQRNRALTDHHDRKMGAPLGHDTMPLQGACQLRGASRETLRLLTWLGKLAIPIPEAIFKSDKLQEEKKSSLLCSDTSPTVTLGVWCSELL
jgi:hypothetical protein